MTKRLILDPQEVWSARSFRSWRPEVDAALLIGWPMSPVAYAASRLRDAGIPYVVDVGDPWILTNPRTTLRWPVFSRAAGAERALWEGASGAVLTTNVQADALRSLYPDLPVLIRPNGYQDGSLAVADQAPRGQAGRSDEAIRLVHFGTLYGVLLDVGTVLARLADSGRWREVKFAQYGHTWPGALDGASRRATVTTHQPVPWEQAMALAREHDVAVVIGAQRSLRMRMPSKAVQYLTLPIPRVAVTCGAEDDPLAQYLRGKPGWLCCTIDDPRMPELLAAHLSRTWSAGELAPPVGESWPRVADEVASFVNSLLAVRR